MWRSIDLSQDGAASIEKLFVENGNLIAISDKKTVYSLTENSYSKVKNVNPPAQYGFDYMVGKTVSYMAHAGNLHYCPVGTFAFSRDVKLNYTPDTSGSSRRISDLCDVDGDTVLSVDNGLKLRVFSSKGDYKVIDLSKRFPGWSSNHSVGAVLKDGKVYWGNREGIPTGLVPIFVDGVRVGYSNAVFEIDVQTGEFIDITENLDCRNRLNQDSGRPFCQITSDWDKKYLYASTEQGLWRRKFDSPGWEKIYNSNNNPAYQMFKQSDGTFVVTASSPVPNTYLYLLYNPSDETWIELPLFASQERKEQAHPVIFNGHLYVKFWRDPKVYVLKLPTERPQNYAQPRLASYLGISDAQASLVHNGGVVLASSKELYFINKDAEKTFLSKLSDEVNQIKSLSDGGLVLAGENSLQVFKDGALIELANFGSAKSRVDVSDRRIAYLCNKTVYFYDTKTLRLLSSPVINEDYVSDLALYGENLLLVVGWNNRRRNGVPVQVAFMHSYIISESATELTYIRNESLWHYNPATLGNDMADTRLFSVEVVQTSEGAKAIVLGESHGGNTIFRWNGRDLVSQTIKAGDFFAHAYNTASAAITYVGIVNVEKMVVERGQLLLCRHPDGGKGNTNRVQVTEAQETIANPIADANQVEGIFYEDGKLYLTTISAAFIPQRDVMKFAGAKIPAYQGQDSSMICLDFKTLQREFWLTPGNGTPVSLTADFAIVRGEKVLLNTTDGSIPTVPNDTYFVAW